MKSHEMLAAKASTVLVSQAPKSRSVDLIRWFARSVTILSQFATVKQRKPYLDEDSTNKHTEALNACVHWLSVWRGLVAEEGLEPPTRGL